MLKCKRNSQTIKKNVGVYIIIKLNFKCMHLPLKNSKDFTCGNVILKRIDV